MPDYKSNFNFSDLDEDAADLMEEAIRETINDIERDAKANAPVVTGELRDSIKGGVSRKNGKIYGYVKASIPDKPQKPLSVEFGHGTDQERTKHPYMRPAFDKHEPHVRERIAKKLKRL